MSKIILFAVATLPFLALTISAGSLSAPKTSDDDSVRVQKAEQVIPESSIVDEVIWVVGDEPILKSEVEALRQYY